MAGDETLSLAIGLGAAEPAEIQAVAEGALLGSYTYTPISATATTPPKIDDDCRDYHAPRPPPGATTRSPRLRASWLARC